MPSLFSPSAYQLVPWGKETARTMATWNVPIFEWLPVLDDGHGRWKEPQRRMEYYPAIQKALPALLLKMITFHGNMYIKYLYVYIIHTHIHIYTHIYASIYTYI